MAGRSPSNIPPSFSLQGLTLEEAYQRLDNEITQLQAHICTLRSLRNSLCPISKIPTELLSNIFLYSQESEEKWPSEEVKVNAYMRFRVSWVCRHWRDTARGTPDLWTDITLTIRNRPIRLDYIEELLVRSQNRAISVNIPYPPYGVMELLAPQMHRMRSMRLDCSPSGIETQTLLSQPAPILTSLEIINCQALPDRLFSGIHPCLRRISAKAPLLPVPAAFPFFVPTVTRLHITNIANIPIDDYFDVLPSLTSLAELVLLQCFRDHQVGPRHEKVKLPNLQALHITDIDMFAAFGLLTWLDVPQADITLVWPHSNGLGSIPQDMRDFFVACDRYAERDDMFHIRHLSIENDSFQYTFDISSSPTENRHSFTFPTWDLHEEQIKWLFKPPRHFDDVESAVFVDEAPDAALEVLMASLNLTSVTLEGKAAMEAFVQARRSDPLTMTFPVLKDLTLRNIDYSDMYRLEEFVGQRHQVGIGLDTLTFVDCPDVDVDGFTDFVTSVSVQASS